MPRPGHFLGYWDQPAATTAKFAGDWLRTGDRGTADDDGYLWFQARDDDVINQRGYRIGPGEVENCLRRHPAVALAAVVGIPDDPAQVVKAFVVLAPGHEQTPGLERDLGDSVRRDLAAYLYPRRIEFVDVLPTTTTGKVRRAELRDRVRAADAGAP